LPTIRFTHAVCRLGERDSQTGEGTITMLSISMVGRF
jgi:hypothetical protein